MELFKLFAKLVLDSSEFKSGVAEAQGSAEDLSESIEEAGGSFDSLASAMIDSGGVASENLEALAELDAEYHKSQQEIARLESALAELDDGSGELTGSMQELSDMLEAEKERAAELKEQMDQLVNSTQKETEEQENSTKASEKAGSSLSKYEAAVKKLKSALQGLIAYKVAKWFWDTTDAVAQFGDHIDKTSQKMNLSAQAYQEWSFIAEHSGTTIDGLRMSMKTLAIQAEKDSDAFAELGMSYEDIHKMSQEELFESTIKALQNVEDTTKRTKLATELLGRGAMELGPLFNASAGDIDAMKKRVEELGGVMSDRLVKNSAAYEDAMTDLQTAVQGAKNNIADFFMEFNTDVILAAANALGYLNRAFDELFPDTFEEELEQTRSGIAALEIAYEKFQAAGDQISMEAVAAELEKAREKEAELEEKVNSSTAAFEAQEDKLAELREAYAETYESVSASLDGWFGAFDNATYEITTSADEMMENLQSQADFWTNYEANLHKLSDAGFGDLVESIEEMGPAGAQYAEVLASMVEGGDEASVTLQDISEKMAEVNEKREKAAETVTAIQFKDNSDETLGNIDSVLKALKNLDGKRATVYVDMQDNTGGMYAYAHAGGLDYVPYHNYPALLHEGERVLTKEENQAYTENINNNQSSVVINQYIETRPQSPVEIAAATAAYFEEARWAV
jgi:hypothetical protein